MAFISCSAPKRDVDKLLKLMDNYSIIAGQAVEDGVLDDKEIEKLNKLSKEISEFEKKMSDKKQGKGEKYSLKVEKLLKTTDAEEVLKNFQKAIYELYKCKGAENLH